MPSRRAQIEMTEDEIRVFVHEQMVMQCATVGPRGVPHMVPLWYVPEAAPHPAQAAEPPAAGLGLIGWTYAKSQKARNLERDARATVGMEEGVSYDQLRGVTFECDVDVERDAGRVEGYGLRLFERYAGELTDDIRAMVAAQAQKRVGLRFRPARTISWDHRKLGGAY